MNSNQKKYYVVWQGKKTGVFDNWNDCNKSVKGVKGAIFKSYPTLKEANKAYKEKPAYQKNEIGKYEKSGYYDRKRSLNKATGLIKEEVVMKINPKSICVDATCSGAIGNMEYRGVWFNTKKLAFSSRKFVKATNNVGEFLAIVEAMKFLEKRNESLIIYSDSKTAINWVKRKKAATTLVKGDSTREAWKAIEEAEKYLAETKFNVMILKWESTSFGENPADYDKKKGRFFSSK